MIPHANGQKLRVSFHKYLDMAYEMIDLNTLSVVMLFYDNDTREIILKALVILPGLQQRLYSSREY